MTLIRTLPPELAEAVLTPDLARLAVSANCRRAASIASAGLSPEERSRRAAAASAARWAKFMAENKGATKAGA